MPPPSDRTQVIIATAANSAHKKGMYARIKSKGGMLTRKNLKPGAVKAVKVAISQIPVVGAGVAAAAEKAMTAMEERHKRRKAAKLKSDVTDAEGEVSRSLKKACDVAALKAIKMQNPLESIDTTRKKMEMSLTEFNKLLSKPLDGCWNCVSLIYHFFRVKVRASKLQARIGVLREILDSLDEQAEKDLENLDECYDAIVAAVNEYQELHDAGPVCVDGKCLNSEGAFQSLEKAQLNQPLLTGLMDDNE